MSRYLIAVLIAMTMAYTQNGNTIIQIPLNGEDDGSSGGRSTLRGSADKTPEILANAMGQTQLQKTKNSELQLEQETANARESQLAVSSAETLAFEAAENREVIDRQEHAMLQDKLEHERMKDAAEEKIEQNRLDHEIHNHHKVLSKLNNEEAKLVSVEQQLKQKEDMIIPEIEKEKLIGKEKLIREESVEAAKLNKLKTDSKIILSELKSKTDPGQLANLEKTLDDCYPDAEKEPVKPDPIEMQEETVVMDAAASAVHPDCIEVANIDEFEAEVEAAMKEVNEIEVDPKQ